MFVDDDSFGLMIISSDGQQTIGAASLDCNINYSQMYNGTVVNNHAYTTKIEGRSADGIKLTYEKDDDDIAMLQLAENVGLFAVTDPTNNIAAGVMIGDLDGSGELNATSLLYMQENVVASQIAVSPSGVVLGIGDLVNNIASEVLITPTDFAWNGKTIATVDQIQSAVQSDWNQSDSSALDYIKNKPVLGTVSSKDFGTSGGNVPILDSNGKLASSVLPAIAITDTFVVSTQAAMLALTAEVGDVCVRTDLNKTYILKEDGASTLSHWQEMLTPTTGVTSVNGQTGAVTLTIPTKTSDLTNDSGFITQSAIPTDYLPLSAGNSKKLTGDLYFDKTYSTIYLDNDSTNPAYIKGGYRTDLKIVSGYAGKIVLNPGYSTYSVELNTAGYLYPSGNGQCLGTYANKWANLYISGKLVNGSTSSSKGLIVPDTSTWTADKTIATTDDVATKQDTISDLSTIRSGAAAGATALQSYTETDPTVPSWAKAANKPTYSYSEITNTPDLSDVVTHDDTVTTATETTFADNYYTKTQTDNLLNRKSNFIELFKDTTTKINTASSYVAYTNLIITKSYGNTFSFSNNAVTVNADVGYVKITMQCKFYIQNTSINRFGAEVHKNGTFVDYTNNYCDFYTESSESVSATFVVIVPVQSGDVLEFYGMSNKTNNELANNTRFIVEVL